MTTAMAGQQIDKSLARQQAIPISVWSLYFSTGDRRAAAIRNHHHRNTRSHYLQTKKALCVIKTTPALRTPRAGHPPVVGPEAQQTPAGSNTSTRSPQTTRNQDHTLLLLHHPQPPQLKQRPSPRPSGAHHKSTRRTKRNRRDSARATPPHAATARGPGARTAASGTSVQ